MYPPPIVDAVLERLRAGPEREALRDAAGPVTRAELFAGSGRIAFELLSRGVRRGDRLVLGLPPDRRFVALFLAALRLGLVTIPLHPKSKLRDVKHVLWDAAPRLALADEPLADLVRNCSTAVRVMDVAGLLAAADAPAQRVTFDDPADAAAGGEEIELLRDHTGTTAEAADPALILYTSGTTGKRKGAVHTQGSLGSMAAALRAAWDLDDDDRLLHCLPLDHLHGLVVGVLAGLAAGVALELEAGFDAERLPGRLAEAKATLFFGVPSMYSRLTALAPPPLPQMRLFVSGSAPLPPALKREFERRYGHVILERYGATEAGIMLSQTLAGGRPAGSVGLPLEGIETRVVAADGGEAAEGELHVRGPSLFRGYFEDDEATAAVLRDGWYRTGDLVRRDEDGTFRILGRLSTDLIKVKGHRVGALEVEAALAEHPGVAEVAVVGAPDPEAGEVVVAFVRPKDGALTVDSLLAHARGQLAPHQVPRRVELVDDLPRTGPGKVDKKQLQARARGE
jgi:acyl-CoA synthetase (AMP-forming)/AMP-acid ligase II